MSDLQQSLDATGVLAIDGLAQPPVPLFLNSGDWIYGLNGRAKINFYYAGQGFIVGFRRGLISDAHFPSGALFRTLGDSFLFSRGQRWDLGPKVGGWPAVRRLRIVAILVKNYAAGWSQVLAGMSGLDRDTIGGYGSNPGPWVMYVESGAVKVDYRLTDNSLHTFTLPTDTTAAELSLDFTIDFEALHGPGSGLKANTTWPFGLGRCPVACNDTGYWGTAGVNWTGNEPPDITLKKFEIYTNSVNLCRIWGPRLSTYAGGPSLPLLEASGGKLLIVHRTQAQADKSEDVRIRDLQIQGAPDGPVISIGAGEGSNMIVERVMAKSGGPSRFLQTLGLTVVYPLTVRDSSVLSVTDTAFFLARASGLTLERSSILASRTSADLIECGGLVHGESMLPSPPSSQKAVFVQTGGDVQYERITSDVEDPDPTHVRPEAFVRVNPWAYFDIHTPMTATIKGCGFGAITNIPKWLASPVPSWAVTPCRVSEDGAETVVVPMPPPVDP